MDKAVRNTVTRYPRKRDVLLIPPVVAFFTYHALLNAHFITVDDPLLFRYLPNLNLRDIFSVEGDIAWFRPILDLSFLMDYWIWRFDPFGYHLTNLMLHSINTILTALLSLTIIENDKTTALLASLLFAVHPVNLECVAWISARADLLSTSAIIASFILLTLYLKNNSKKFIYLILSASAYFVALLVKETAIVFIPVTISYIFFYRKSWPNGGSRRFLPLLLLFLLLFLSITAGYFFIRSSSISGSDQTGIIPELYYLHMIAPFSDDPDLATAVFHFLIPVLNLAGTFGFYLKKLIFPYPLNMHIQSINEDVYALLSLGVLSVLITLIRKRRTPIFLFSAFFLWLAPAFPIAFTNISWTHYSERYLYLPGIFLIIGAAFLIKTIPEKAGWTMPWVGGLTLLILFQFSSAVISHENVWQNSIALNQHLIRISPERAKSYEILGIFHFSEGRFDDAKKMLQTAVKLGARHTPFYYLGLMALRNGDEEKGISLLKKSAEPLESSINYYKTMGDYYLDKSDSSASNRGGYLKEALKYYNAAYNKKSKSDQSILFRLSMANYMTGNFKAAEKYAEELSSRFPDSTRAYAARKYTR